MNESLGLLHSQALGSESPLQPGQGELEEQGEDRGADRPGDDTVDAVDVFAEDEVTEGDDGLLEVFLRGSVTALDGSDAVRLSASGPLNTAEEIGRRLAAELIDLGANTMMGSS